MEKHIRIVSLIPSATEIVATLGLQNAIVVAPMSVTIPQK